MSMRSPTNHPSAVGRRTSTCQLAVVVLSATVLAVTGCGSSSGPPEKGLLIAGPGVRATAPPWPVQDQNLAQRIRRLGLPAGGSEKFHIHALLSIYNQGLLVTVPANVGIDERQHVESSLHTHDATGIVHMEAPAPHRFTLGDFFTEWGVRFGAGTLGAWQDDGSNRVWVYVNGRLITDPARHVLANGDNISIGYGPQGSFPHVVHNRLFAEVLAGRNVVQCSSSATTKKGSTCRAPKQTSKPK